MTDEQVPVERPKMTPEHRQKMQEGRERAKAQRIEAAKRLLKEAGLLKEMEVTPPESTRTTRAIPDVKPPSHAGAVDEFAGLTRHNCASACREGHCVISRDGICVHPFKGGLHMVHQMKPDVVQRFQASKDKIEMDDLKRRQAHA